MLGGIVDFRGDDNMRSKDPQEDNFVSQANASLNDQSTRSSQTNGANQGREG
jgi:hypothetical protein